MPVSMSLTTSRRSNVRRSLASRKAFFSARTASASSSNSSVGLFDLPAPALAGEAFAVRTIATNDQPAVDQNGQVPPQRCRRHAVCTGHELLVRRPDNQFTVARELRFWMEREQGVQNGECAVRCTDQVARFPDRVEHLPLLNLRAFRHGLCYSLACHHAKRHRSPPKGRRWGMRLHFSSPIARQKKPARRIGAQTDLNGLDYDSRKWDSLSRQT
jgi:hypothetical protein